MEFDHVALATDDVTPALEVLVSDLGGTIISGGAPGPFRALQLRLGAASDGMTIELIEPWDPREGEFLRRFLAERGAGPHHLTLKTDDIGRELQRIRSLGIEPVGVSIDAGFWREFFIHPADGHGTVVQIAQLMVDEPPMDERMKELAAWSTPWWPPIERGSSVAVLEQVVLGSPEPEDTLAFFSGVLGGTRIEGDVVSWGRDRVHVERADTLGIRRLEIRGIDEAVRVAGTDLVPFRQ